MTTIGDIIYDEALTHKGTWEWAGDDHNPEILRMFTEVGHANIKNDETPWCAAFVGSVLAGVGIGHTSSLMAKSYLDWGEKVPLNKAEKGDIVILHRGDPKKWTGHVGFLDHVTNKHVYLLGGNQGDQVNIRPYGLDRIAGVRRPKKQRKHVAESTTVGASGAGAAGAIAAGGSILQSTGSLGETAQIVAIVGIIVALLAFAWVFRERIKKWLGGDR